MSYGISLHVWGDYACFTRPEMKVERVSYDVMTPSAARGILDAIHWKPAIRWVIDRIHVLRPIRFQTIRRNEVGSKISARNVKAAMASNDITGLRLVVEEDRQQRATVALRDVGYLIEAHFELTDRAKADDTAAKHRAIFLRRPERGPCFPRPCLALLGFPAEFELAGPAPPSPPPHRTPSSAHRGGRRSRKASRQRSSPSAASGAPSASSGRYPGSTRRPSGTQAGTPPTRRTRRPARAGPATPRPSS